MKAKNRTWIVAVAMALTMTGCYDDGVEGDSFYVSQQQTIGDFLDADEQYDAFNRILARAGIKGLMTTYGQYTCLAPTNEAIEQYITEHHPGMELEALPDSTVIAIAKSHIIGEALLTHDMHTGYLPRANMYERKIQVAITQEYDPARGDSTTVYRLNTKSRIIAANDTVTNGVVHTIDHVLEQSSYVLPDYMQSRCEALGFTLFMAALQKTQLTELMLEEKDESEAMTQKLAQYAAKYTGTGDKVPASRRLGYTVFVEKDEVYATIIDPLDANKPIYTGDLESDIVSLANYAKVMMDKVYPNDTGLYDNNPAHRKNPLNRYIAYHILDRNVGYNNLVNATRDWSVNEGGDYTEYYETLEGNLLRLQAVSSKGNAVYLNRFIRSNNAIEGVEVKSTEGESTINGNFQFVNGILKFDAEVVSMFKNTRIRIDTGSLLKELTNNDIRLDKDDEMLWWYFPTGYFDGLDYDDNSECKYNRWPAGKSAGNGTHKDLAAHQTDNLNFDGEYDVTIRFPAVPAGQYEIRLGYCCNALMSISQIYFGYDKQLMMPVGIPLDMNLTGMDPKVGMIQDINLFDDITSDASANVGGLVTITENDRAMRNLGYMKGPAAMYRVENDRVTQKTKMTNDWWYMRRIITTQQLDGRPFYLRFRKVDERTGRLLNLDFIEVCPRSIYNGAVPEDRF